MKGYGVMLKIWWGLVVSTSAPIAKGKIYL